jgi:hypothetical protein
MSDFLSELRHEVVDAHARYGRRTKPGRAVRGLHPRGWRPVDLLAPAAIAVCVAIAVIAVVVLRGPSRTASLKVAMVARIGGEPMDAASGFGSLWVADYQQRLVRVDPVSGRVLARIPLTGTATSVAVDAAGAWVASEPSGDTPGRHLERIDPRTARVAQRVGLRTFSAALAATRQAVWVLSTHSTGTRLMRVDPATGRATATVRPLPVGTSVSAAGAVVWTLDNQGVVMARDAGSGRALRDLGRVGLALGPTDNLLSADGAGAWVVGADGRSVLRLEGGSVVRRIAVATAGPLALAVDGDTLWLASGDQVRGRYRLQRIDEGRGAVTATVDLQGHPPRALVPVRDGVAVVAADGVVLFVRS